MNKTLTLISNNNNIYDLEKIQNGFENQLKEIFNENIIKALSIEIETKEIKTKFLNKTIISEVPCNLILTIQDEYLNLENIIKEEFKKYINNNLTKLF